MKFFFTIVLALLVILILNEIDSLTDRIKTLEEQQEYLTEDVLNILKKIETHLDTHANSKH